jgi:sugar lactone lactonase YvrE
VLTTLDGARVTIAFEDAGGSIAFGLRFRASDGALFVPDALQGAVLRVDDPSRAGNTCPADSRCVQTVLQDGVLMATNGGIGANGLALSEDESTLFVANSDDGVILALPLAGGGAPRVLAEAINFPDGLLAGPDHTLITTATRANEVVVIDATTGQIRARLGAFLGLDAAGAPIGLLDPAQVVRAGDALVVSNFANPLRTPGVRAFTLSRVSLPEPEARH